MSPQARQSVYGMLILKVKVSFAEAVITSYSRKALQTDKSKHRRIAWNDRRETMAKKKPYIAPKILFCDFNNSRYIGNDTDKIDEINKIIYCENAIMAEEFDSQALCPLDRELYCVSEN